MKTRAKLLCLLAPTALLAALVFASRAQATGGAGALSVCRHRASDGKGSRPVDLARVDAAYAGVAAVLRERLKNLEKRVEPPGPQGHDSGLRACRRSETRDLALPGSAPAVLRGKRLFFVAVLPGGRWPPGVPPPTSGAIVFLLSYRSLEEAGFLARALGVGVSAADRGLAERFGVRCASTVVQVSDDGKKLTIEEIAP